MLIFCYIQYHKDLFSQIQIDYSNSLLININKILQYLIPTNDIRRKLMHLIMLRSNLINNFLKKI